MNEVRKWDIRKTDEGFPILTFMGEDCQVGELSVGSLREALQHMIDAVGASDQKTLSELDGLLQLSKDFNSDLLEEVSELQDEVERLRELEDELSSERTRCLDAEEDLRIVSNDLDMAQDRLDAYEEEVASLQQQIANRDRDKQKELRGSTLDSILGVNDSDLEVQP